MIWTRFVEFDSEEERLRLPAMFKASEQNRLTVHCGLRIRECDIESLAAADDEETVGTSFETPAVTYISSRLAKTLHIHTNLIYQLKLEEDQLVIGPTLGLLFGNNQQNYTPDFMKEHYSERLRVYPQIGGMIVAFAITAVDWTDSTIDGLIYDPVSENWIPSIAPIPAVTYRRHVRQPNFKEFRNNLYAKKGILFNSARYTKWKVHNTLQKNPLLLKYLPETVMLENHTQLIRFLDQYGKVVLKPRSGSQGKGILFIEKAVADGTKKYVLSDYRDNKSDTKKSLHNSDSLRKVLEESQIFKKKYICQQFISLAKIDGAPFDVRILMQKEDTQVWKCSGIECRIASKDKEVTNLAAGGNALSLQETVMLMGPAYDYELIHEQILKFCSEFCFWMDQMKGHHYAEFGIDIGLDHSGNPWFIEANYRPGFKGFKRFDYNMFLEIGYQPFRYATRLQGFQLEEPSSVEVSTHEETSPPISSSLDDDEEPDFHDELETESV